MDQEILDTINNRLAELEKIHTRYQGPPGKQGKGAPPPRIVIGTVSSGEQADAKIRKADGTFFLDLCLPRGADGRDGFSDCDAQKFSPSRSLARTPRGQFIPSAALPL